MWSRGQLCHCSSHTKTDKIKGSPKGLDKCILLQIKYLSRVLSKIGVSSRQNEKTSLNINRKH